MGDLSITREGSLTASSKDPAAQLRQVANQFEAVFVQKLFEGINQAEEDDPPLVGGGNEESQFKQLLQTGLSERVAGHLGIADVMVRELSKRNNTTHPSGSPS